MCDKWNEWIRDHHVACSVMCNDLFLNYSDVIFLIVDLVCIAATTSYAHFVEYVGSARSFTQKSQILPKHMTVFKTSYIWLDGEQFEFTRNSVTYHAGTTKLWTKNGFQFIWTSVVAIHTNKSIHHTIYNPLYYQCMVLAVRRYMSAYASP